MDIEKEIADVFKKLLKEKYNASFAYSFVYTNEKDIKTAEIEGRVNIHGSKEEVEVHIESIQRIMKQEEAATKKRYARNTKTK